MLVIGAGGQASNVVNLAIALNYSVQGFIHDGKSGQTLFGKPIFADLQDIESVNDYVYCMAVGDNYQREKYLEELRSLFPDLVFPALVHPTCSVGPYSQIGDGSVVMPQTVIGTNSLVGEFCVLGNQSCLGHDSQLADFSSLGPASTLGGDTRLGRRSAVGMGAKVREKVSIGADSILGACSFLNDNLQEAVIAFGTPAKMIRSRQVGDSYLR